MEQSKVMIGDKCAEIYTYESPDLVYAMNWSVSFMCFEKFSCNVELGSLTTLTPAAESTG